MNILVINWQDRLNPLAGGAEVHLHEVFSRIVRAGHDVTVMCTSFPGAASEETLDGLRILRNGSRNFFNYEVPGLYRALTKRQRFDVVVDDLNKIPFFTPWFVREPIYGIVHHLFGTSIYREVDPLTASYVAGMERFALSVYKRNHVPFMAVSPSSIEAMRRIGFPESSLSLVHLGVDHNLYSAREGSKESTPLVGYVGRLKKYKSIHHLIEAFAVVKQDIPGVRLVIVGDGDDRPRLESVVNRLELGQSVTFTGYVSEQEKAEWMRRMWVMAMPSSKEGWGLTVTEANACGTTVVASDVPGLRDAVEHGHSGLLFPYGDTAALARSIVRVLRDDAERNRLSKGALEFAARFTWDIAASRTINALTGLVGR
jgi:glycosyltransferase involved in cell wall biosynthesis